MTSITPNSGGAPEAFCGSAIHGQLDAAGKIVSALGSDGGAGLGAKVTVSQILPKLTGLGPKAGQVAGVIADVGINPLAGGVQASNTARQDALKAGKTEAEANAAAKAAFIESYVGWGSGKGAVAKDASRLKNMGEEKLAKMAEDTYSLVSDYRVQDLIGFLGGTIISE